MAHRPGAPARLQRLREARVARSGGRAPDGSASSDVRHQGLKTDLSILARGGAVSFIGGAASAVLGFVFIVVITRGLRAGRAGVFFEALALFNILSNVAELGADTGLVRFIPKLRATGRTRDVRRILWLGLWPAAVAGVVLGGLQLLLATPLSHVFIHKAHPEAAVPYWQILGLMVPLSSVSTVAIAATRGFGTMTPYIVISDYVRPLLRPLLALGVIAAGLGSLALGIAYSVPIVIGFVMAVVWLARLLRRAERSDEVQTESPRGVRTLAGEFWRFAAPRGIAATFSVTVFSLDTLLLGALKATKDAGIYAASTRYLTVGALALQAILLVIAPQVSAMLATDNHERAESVFATSTWWLVATSWPPYLVVATFAPVLLSVFGPEFQAGQNVLVILSLAMLVNLATGPVNAVLLMGGKSSWNLINTLIALALNVGLNLWLIPIMGMEGAAVAWAVSIVFNNVAALVEVWIFLRLHPLGSGFYLVSAGALVVFGGLGLLARVTLGATWLALIASGIMATVIYGAYLWRFRYVLRIQFLREGLSLKNQKALARTQTEQPRY